MSLALHRCVLSFTALACSLIGTMALAKEAPPSSKLKPPLTGQTLTVETHGRKPDLKGFNPSACFPVGKIIVKGIELVDVEDVRKKVEPLAYRCLDNALATAIVLAVNESHSGKGFVTTQGVLPDQDIRKAKTLAVEVYTGRIAKILYKEPETDEDLPFTERLSKSWGPVKDANGPWGIVKGLSGVLDTLDDPLDRFQLLDGRDFDAIKPWATFELSPEIPVQIDRLQENADLMNRVPSNKTTAKLEAGERPATSNVVFSNPRQDSFRLVMGYETNGAALNNTGSTVDQRIRFDLAKDNLIGINDMWKATIASGIDTNELTASFSVPWRRFSFGVSGSYSESLNEVIQGVELFSRTGVVSGSLSYALERAKNVQTSLDASLTWRQSDRNINGIDLGLQTFSIVRAGVSRTHLIDTWQLSYGAGYNQGLTIWDALRDPPDPADDIPRAQFWKIDGSLGLAKTFKDIGTWRIDAAGQWAEHPLYSDDQLTLGSSTTVRGFTNFAAKVDRGAIIRSEASFILPADILLGSHKDNLVLAHEFLSALRPYIFADYGFGRQIADKRDIARSGIGAGFRYSHGRLNVDFAYAHPVYEQGTRHDDKGPEIYLTASMKLF